MSLHLPKVAFATGAQVTIANHCGNRAGGRPTVCWRPMGHGGRHAYIDDGDGEVLRVWGEDFHAEARAKGRPTARTGCDYGKTCGTVCEHCGCCEHTPDTYQCDGRPDCAWYTCGCGVV